MKKALYCLMALALSQSALAQSHVNKIKQTQTITVGYMDDDFPFSYMNEQGIYSGFGADLTNQVAAHISQELGFDKPLKVEIKPMTFQNRFEMMQKGELDFSCSAHSNLPERKKWVDFSYNFFVARGRLMVRHDSGIESYKQLEGKNIAVLKDSSVAAAVDKKRHQFKFKEPIQVESSDEAFNLLREGKVDGIFDDDILLTGFVARKKESDQYHMVGQALTLDNYACIVPKGDAEMKGLVDRALFTIFTEGKMEPMFKHWFQETIPDLGINLQFEFNQSIKNLYASPNDKAIGGE